MADAVWELDSSDGQLTVMTAVAGPASRVGHRLTIAMGWHGTVEWADEPVAVELTADVGSLEVLRGDGGATPLSGPEKALVRLNALKTLMQCDSRTSGSGPTRSSGPPTGTDWSARWRSTG